MSAVLQAGVVRIATGTLLLLAAWGLTRRAGAAPVSWIGGHGDWNDDASWSGGAEPGSGDDTTIGNGATVTVTQSGETTRILVLDNGSTVRQAGGSLALNTNWVSGGEPGIAYPVIRGGASYVLEAGSLLNPSGSRDGKLYVDNGSFIQNGGVFMGSNPSVSAIDDVYVGFGTSGSGLLRITNGSFYNLHVNAYLGAAYNDAGGTGRIEVSGSSIGAIHVGAGLVLGRNGTLAFELDAGGVTPICVAMRSGYTIPKVDLDSVLGAASLEVSLLELPPQSDLMLIDFRDSAAVEGTFASLPQGAQVQAGLGNTVYHWTISYVGGNGNDVVLLFDHVSIIPEPRALALAALGLLPALYRRRHRAG